MVDPTEAVGGVCLLGLEQGFHTVSARALINQISDIATVCLKMLMFSILLNLMSVIVLTLFSPAHRLDIKLIWRLNFAQGISVLKYGFTELLPLSGGQSLLSMYILFAHFGFDYLCTLSNLLIYLLVKI